MPVVDKPRPPRAGPSTPHGRLVASIVHAIRFMAGLVLAALALIVGPGLFVFGAALHREQCGSSLFCNESLAQFALHQALTEFTIPLGLYIASIAIELLTPRR